MAEEAIAPEQVVDAPAQQQEELPAVTPEMREAFAARTPGDTPPPTEQAAAPEAAPVAKDTPPPAAKPADYGDLLKDLGVESLDVLKERWNAAKDYDPKTVEQLRANQRDAQDEAIRTLIATDPEKARAYFDLQALPVDALATGTPEQQRELLFTAYKLANPELTGRLAELGFNKEFTAKFALMDSEDPDDAEDAEFAKLQYNLELKRATPAVKAAQESQKIALVPKPEAANQLTPAQEQALADEWLKGVNDVLAQPKIEQVFQTENGPVTVGFDTKDAELKSFLDKPLDAITSYLDKVAYPNGFDKPADMAALAKAYLRLTKPEAIATAAAAVGKASVGAHVPMTKLVNPTPDAPAAPLTEGDDQAGAVAAMRAVAQGRR